MNKQTRALYSTCPVPGHLFCPLNLPSLTFSEQVFHVPLEERKYKDMNQFGEGEQAKICLEIMQRTGAHLELSLAKDQGLSIMVSGKLDAVMKARKDIVARLQTQVRAPGRPSRGASGPVDTAPMPSYALPQGGRAGRSRVGQQHSEPLTLLVDKQQLAHRPGTPPALLRRCRS